MSREIGSFAPNITAWSKEFEDASSKFQSLVALAKDLDQRLQDVTAELNNETETRKNWMKRANAAENRQKLQQFILVLLDGNQIFFKDDIIRTGASAAQSAVQSLLAEVQDAAESRHKNDLPSSIQIVMHIFVDFERLFEELMCAGYLSTRQQLEDFTTSLTASTPLLTVTDCGPGREGVDAKIQGHYELFIENVQCRHLILGLDQQSEYFATLDMYSEDAYTLGKTSLVRTMHGFPSKYNLPFHQVEFSSIDSVPLIALNADQDHAADASPTAVVRDRLPAASPQMLQSTPADDPVHLKQNAQGSESSSRSVREGSNGGRSGQQTSVPSSQTSHSASSRGGRPAQKLPSGPSVHKTTVTSPPEPSTYNGVKASFQSDWETRPAEDMYAAPPCTAPWGSDEQDVSENIDEAFPPFPKIDQRTPKQSYARAGAPSSKQQNTRSRAPPTNVGAYNNPPRRPATSFKGSWDDLLSSNIDDVPTGPRGLLVSSPGLDKTLKPSNPGKVALNRHGDRVDEPLSPLSHADRSRLKDRVKDRHLCNEHHLQRGCRNDNCRYDHEISLDAGLLLALRHLARTQACSIGSRCRMAECCHGHHCPNQNDGKECRYPNCSFKKMSLHHVRDLKVAERIPIATE